MYRPYLWPLRVRQWPTLPRVCCKKKQPDYMDLPVSRKWALLRKVLKPLARFRGLVCTNVHLYARELCCAKLALGISSAPRTTLPAHRTELRGQSPIPNSGTSKHCKLRFSNSPVECTFHCTSPPLVRSQTLKSPQASGGLAIKNSNQVFCETY